MAKAKKIIRANVIVAQVIHLVDSNNTMRGEIYADDPASGGEASVKLYDCSRRPRVHMTIRRDGTPHFGLLREDGAVVLGIGVSELGGTGLEIYDSGGRMVLTLRVSPTGELYYP